MAENDKPVIELKNLIVKPLLDAIPGCQAIYRFGSWETSAQRSDSDIDIAVLPPDVLEPVRRWELAQTLASLLGRDVDLVDLLSASTVLRMQVVAHGEVLFTSNASAVEQFEDMVYSSYARLNEERRDILADVRQRGNIYGK
jgi:predicted nucleotidyltransferase